MKCKDCVHFNRTKWHKDIDPRETDQKGGNCSMLKDILGLSNDSLYFKTGIHVYESFGCTAFKEISADNLDKVCELTENY
jgi:hypothetical protein